MNYPATLDFIIHSYILACQLTTYQERQTTIGTGVVLAILMKINK
jgi:hypothetical protein